jgi:cell division protein FtsQ
MRATRIGRDIDEASLARKRLRDASKARRIFEREEVRRFTAHLRRRRIIWASGLGIFVALLLFVAVGAFTPVMALQQITVAGASRVPVAQIQAALQGEIGKPLPLVSFGAIKEAVAAQPLIQSYSTESLPPHTLLIRIVERVPVGYFTSDGGFTLVDPAGVVIETSSQRIAGYPLFTVAGNSTVIVLADSGARVFWGGPENAALKSRVLAALIASAPVGTVSEYDVSSPQTAVVR